MKTKIALLIALIVFCFATSASPASLQWTAPTTNEGGSPLTDLAGHNAYDVTTGAVKLNATLIALSFCTTATPRVCTWPLPTTPVKGQKYVVTAVDSTAEESAYSNIATFKVKPSAPASLIILSSLDVVMLGEWGELILLDLYPKV
jgi:hypothetical protein